MTSMWLQGGELQFNDGVFYHVGFQKIPTTLQITVSRHWISPSIRCLGGESLNPLNRTAGFAIQIKIWIHVSQRCQKQMSHDVTLVFVYVLVYIYPPQSSHNLPYLNWIHLSLHERRSEPHTDGLPIRFWLDGWVPLVDFNLYCLWPLYMWKWSNLTTNVDCLYSIVFLDGWPNATKYTNLCLPFLQTLPEFAAIWGHGDLDGHYDPHPNDHADNQRDADC